MDDEDALKIRLNVGGVRHETYLSTLMSVPGTRLAKLAEFHEKAIENGRGCLNGEYFFDRHPGVFQTILDFYRTTELHHPLDICGAVFRRELKYWGIDEGCFRTCCLTRFSSFTDSEKLLNSLRQQLEGKPGPFGSWLQDIVQDTSLKAKIWYALNTPRSSVFALIYAFISMSVVILSLIGYCLETMEQFTIEENVTCTIDGVDVDSVIHTRYVWLEWIDISCSIFILAELITKLICAPHKAHFIKNIMTVFDLLSLIPSIVYMVMFWPHIHCMDWLTTFLNVTMLFRVLRVFRLVYFLRHYGPFRVLIYSIKSAMNAMVMLVVFMAVSVIFFGALVFYAERISTHQTSQETDFPDLTSGFWWAIITLTTVGYGDKIVRTSLGYAIGSVAAISGLVMLAFVVPIISNQFTMLYNFDVAMKNVHTHCQVKRRRRNLSTNNSITLKEIKKASILKISKRGKGRSPSTVIAEKHQMFAGKRRKAFPDAEHVPAFPDVDVGPNEFEHCLQGSLKHDRHHLRHDSIDENASDDSCSSLQESKNGVDKHHRSGQIRPTYQVTGCGDAATDDNNSCSLTENNNGMEPKVRPGRTESGYVSKRSVVSNDSEFSGPHPRSPSNGSFSSMPSEEGTRPKKVKLSIQENSEAVLKELTGQV